MERRESLLLTVTQAIRLPKSCLNSTYNIYIILITCSYHILQTLNAIVFGLVEKASRKELNKLAVTNDSTQLGKTLFIKCYYKADIASFTLNFFIKGLKAPRLWTISNATLFENAMITKLEVLSITPPG